MFVARHSDPFAVRNTMLFVRGFMLTEADGTSPVEWLDPAWSGNMELISGAAATTFGETTGGALVVHGASNPQLATVQTVLGTTGSGGLQAPVECRCIHPRVERAHDPNRNSGYRDQEWDRRWQFEADRAWGNRKAKHYDWVAFQDGSWGLPGAITEDDSATSALRVALRRAGAPKTGPLGTPSPHPQPQCQTAQEHLDVWGLVRWTDKTNPFGTGRFFICYKEESRHRSQPQGSPTFCEVELAKSDFRGRMDPDCRGGPRRLRAVGQRGRANG